MKMKEIEPGGGASVPGPPLDLPLSYIITVTGGAEYR